MSQKKLPIQRTFDFSALRLAFTAVLGITLGMVQSAVSEPLILSGHTDQVAAVAVSPDGTRILSGGWDDTGRIWDAASGALLHTFALHEDWITSVAFSPDGSRIALGSWDQSLSVWNAVGGDPVLHAPSPRGFVLDVVFAPSGEALWTSLGRRYGTQLRDIATGTELAKLSTTNRDGTWCVALSPDGSQVAVGGVGQADLYLERTVCRIHSGAIEPRREHLFAGLLALGLFRSRGRELGRCRDRLGY